MFPTFSYPTFVHLTPMYDVFPSNIFWPLTVLGVIGSMLPCLIVLPLPCAKIFICPITYRPFITCIWLILSPILTNHSIDVHLLSIYKTHPLCSHIPFQIITKSLSLYFVFCLFLHPDNLYPCTLSLSLDIKLCLHLTPHFAPSHSTLCSVTLCILHHHTLHYHTFPPTLKSGHLVLEQEHNP